MIKSGDFGNGSEYIRHLIRRDQMTKKRLAVLRLALLEGKSSGESRPVDMSAIKAAGRNRMKSAE